MPEVRYGKSELFCCFTTTAFLPLAALPLASPLCQSGTDTAFLGYLSHTATPALSSVVLLLPPLWLNSSLVTFPAPMVNYWPLSPYSLMNMWSSHRIPQVPSFATFYESGQLSLAKLWLFLILLAFTLSSNTSQIHYLLLLFNSHI